MTHPNSNKPKVVKVYVDYWMNGLWAAWIRHTKGKPNVVDLEPTETCDTVREFLKMHGQVPNFVFSPAVLLLHQVRARVF